jgi:hypothetical protein
MSRRRLTIRASLARTVKPEIQRRRGRGAESAESALIC